MRTLFVIGLALAVGCEKKPTAAAPVLDPARISLDTVTPERATELNGQAVVATLTVATPFYFWDGKTIVGSRDLPDGVGRSAVLAGERFDVDEGRRLTVAGRLMVIDHPADTVGGAPVPAWREIRVVEAR